MCVSVSVCVCVCEKMVKNDKQQLVYLGVTVVRYSLSCDKGHDLDRYRHYQAALFMHKHSWTSQVCMCTVCAYAYTNGHTGP